jgi:hypothetical protein
MAKIRTGYGTSIIAALTFAMCGISLPSAAQAASQCTGTLAQYTANIKQLEGYAARVQALAQQNPLYESDVAYYTSVLADAERCAKTLGPITTVSR